MRVADRKVRRVVGILSGGRGSLSSWGSWVALLALAAGCTGARAGMAGDQELVAVDDNEPPAGATKQDAISVCQPRGEMEYLRALICADGESPRFERKGSVGPRHDPPPDAAQDDWQRWMDPQRRVAPGERDQHVIDEFQVVCGTQTHTVYLDMYHCADPPTRLVPRGFRLLQ